jgi:predicted NAD/FAD-binding protein
MSFSLRCEQTGLEYCPSSFDSLFAQRRNLLRPSFYRMVMDIFRFRKEGLKLLETHDDHVTLADYLERENYSPLFIEKFILPMGAAVWSADPIRFEFLPATSWILPQPASQRNQPQWLASREVPGSMWKN